MKLIICQNYALSMNLPEMLNMNKEVWVFKKKCNWATMILFTCMWSHSWKWSQYCSRYFRTSVWWTKEGRCFAKGKSGNDITSLGILVLVCEKNTWQNIIKPQYCFKDLKCITGYWYFKKSLKGGYYVKITFKKKRLIYITLQ